MMYPHERSLVKKFEHKPFVILGINSDGNREQLKQVLVKEQITWRSWFDGGSTFGPIATQWQIQSWPTLYVLDHRGVIRGKSVGAREWSSLLDQLLQQQAAEQKH